MVGAARGGGSEEKDWIACLCLVESGQMAPCVSLASRRIVLPLLKSFSSAARPLAPKSGEPVGENGTRLLLHEVKVRVWPRRRAYV